jgi:threonine dehydrogenase-like Zn-dependent dehydrogenase
LWGRVCYCRQGGDPDFRPAGALRARRPDLAEILVSHRFPLARASEAFAVANDKRAGSLKVVLEP